MADTNEHVDRALSRYLKETVLSNKNWQDSCKKINYLVISHYLKRPSQ